MCKFGNYFFPALVSSLDSVFVNGRDRSAILDDMQARIDRNNVTFERAEAIKAMCQIAADRARKLQC